MKMNRGVPDQPRLGKPRHVGSLVPLKAPFLKPLVAVALVLCCLPVGGDAARGGPRSTREPSGAEVVAAFAAVSAMVLALKEEVVALRRQQQLFFEPAVPCWSGFGYFQGSIWYPHPVGSEPAVTVDFPPVRDTPVERISEFYVGAPSHDVTGECLLAPLGNAECHVVSGHRLLSRVEECQTDPGIFITTTVCGCQWALDMLQATFGLCGSAATNLGTALTVKAVRTALKTTLLSSQPGDTLWRGLKHLANAGDAFRHLTVARIYLLQSSLGDAISTVANVVDVFVANEANSVPPCTAATRIQAAWRGWSLRTFAVDLRGAWMRLRAVYAVLARGNVVLDIATENLRVRKPDDPVRPLVRACC